MKMYINHSCLHERLVFSLCFWLFILADIGQPAFPEYRGALLFLMSCKRQLHSTKKVYLESNAKIRSTPYNQIWCGLLSCKL